MRFFWYDYFSAVGFSSITSRPSCFGVLKYASSLFRVRFRSSSLQDLRELQSSSEPSSSLLMDSLNLRMLSLPEEDFDKVLTWLIFVTSGRSLEVSMMDPLSLPVRLLVGVGDSSYSVLTLLIKTSLFFF